jgi:uncharacterized DUF497 family protein
MVDEAVSPVFDRDDGNLEHCRKHGVPIAEIEALLRGTPRIAPDLKHAHLEDRLIAVGRTARGRPLFVAFNPGEVRAEDDPPGERPLHARKGDQEL